MSAVTGCTGIITVTLDKVAGAPTPTYSWTWSGSYSNNSAVTTADFDVTNNIGKDGTYSFSLTVTGKDSKGADAVDNVTLSINLNNCTTTEDDDDDNVVNNNSYFVY